MFNYLGVTLLLLSITFNGYSQERPIIVTYNNTTRYCITETQALLTVEVFDQSEVHKGIIIDLELKVETLEGKLLATDTILIASNDLLVVEGERLTLTKKELRKAKRRAVGTWFKNAYDKILYLVGGVSLGVGIGYLAK